MLVSSNSRPILLRSGRWLTAETRRYESREAASTAYLMHYGAMLFKHSNSEVRSCVSGPLRKKEKKTGAMAGQTDIHDDDAIPVAAQALSVKYENAHGFTRVKCSARAQCAILEAPKAAFQLIRQSIVAVLADSFAVMGDSRSGHFSPSRIQIEYRLLRDVVVGHCAVFWTCGAKKMAGRMASQNPFGETSLHVTSITSSTLSVAYENASRLTRSKSVVYPVNCGRRHLSLGIGVSTSKRRTTADRRYFFVRCHAFAFNGRALVGERSRSPVSFCAGTPTLSCAWPPQLALGAGFVEPAKGGNMRPAIPARSEQTQSPLQIQIINRALRDAALAPSANDALDCCADALLHLAELARAEVARG